MRNGLTLMFAAMLVLVTVVASAGVQQAGRPQATVVGEEERTDSVREFVGEFYAWYARTMGGLKGLDLALKERSRAFSTVLFQALKADRDAQANVSGFIVGLDFDPLTGHQYTCERYEVGDVTPKAKTDRVEVFAVCSGRKSAKPDVVAEVGREGGHFVFVNFFYENTEEAHPQSTNLLAILKLLQEARAGRKPNRKRAGSADR